VSAIPAADEPGDGFADLLRRGVVVLGAALVLVLPQFTTDGSFAGPPGAAGPVGALLAGLALWLMPVLLAASWAAGGRARIAHPWLAVPVGLFVAGAVISTVWAADKSSAMVRAAELSGVWVALLALVLAIRTDAERRLLAAAIVAAAFLAAVTAIYQGTVGLPQAAAQFQAHWQDELAALGWSPTDENRRLFTERFTGGVQAAMGHPNVLAAMLLVAILLAVGAIREKWSEPAGKGARAMAAILVAVAAILVVALVMTKSRGGIGALLLGGYLLTVAWTVRRRAIRIALWVLPFVVAAAALLAAARSDHPAVQAAILSLKYRLDYWRATWPIIRSHWAAGVGLENFGDYYVQHKLAGAPEEIRDPHNMWLSVWSQVGLAGFLAAVMLFAVAVRCWVVALRTPHSALRTEGASLLGWLVAVLVVAGPALVYLAVGPNSLVPDLLAAPAIGLAAVVLGVAAGEDAKRLRISERPQASVRGAAIAAVVAFGVQDLIGTAFLAPATAWVLLVLVGISVRGSDPPAARRVAPWLQFVLTVLAMGAVFAYVYFLLIPVGREAALLRMASGGALPIEQEEYLREAGRVNPWAWEPAMARGRLWQSVAGDSPEGGSGAAVVYERAIRAYEDALRRNPRLLRAWLRMADCRLAIEGALDDRAPGGALDAARGYFNQAVRLYPTRAETRLRLADVLERLGDDAAATAEYRKALELDAAMADEARRLDPETRRLIEARLGKAK